MEVTLLVLMVEIHARPALIKLDLEPHFPAQHAIPAIIALSPPL
jgi:hypothetical protein